VYVIIFFQTDKQSSLKLEKEAGAISPAVVAELQEKLKHLQIEQVLGANLAKNFSTNRQTFG